MPISQEQLNRIMPRCQAETWVEPLNQAMARFEITSPQRMAAFLAQIAHESGELRRLVENLNYSASRLMQVWPSRFSTIEKAERYANNPERLANYVYAKRLGNGDEASGDGWRFRGRGLIQLTGRGNYKSVGEATDLSLEQQPELLEQSGPAAISAAHFWRSHGLNELADDQNDDDDDEDFVTITVRINGGKAGLAERRKYWVSAKNALGLS